MGFKPIEPQIGVALCGIGVAMLLGDFRTEDKAGAGALIGALFAIAGTLLGTSLKWGSPPSWWQYWDDASPWPDLAWLAFGVLAAGLILWIAARTSSDAMSATLFVLSLAQFAAVAAPITSRLIAARRDTPWYALRKVLRSCSAETAMQQRCPECGHALRLDYRALTGLEIRCTHCNRGLYGRAGEMRPPWMDG